MKIFLTGGTGFIGSHVVKELSDNHHEIIVLARNSKKIPALGKLKGVQLIEGNIAESNSYKKYLKGTDALVHIALHWGNSAIDMLLNDTLSSVQLFEMAAKAGIQEIIYTSSTAVNDWVYMDDEARRGGEKHTVFENTKQNPVTYYGATKGASELYLQAIASEYKLKANVVRPGYTFGNPAIPGGDIESDSRFSDLVKNALTNKTIDLIKNDGTQFIDASDLAIIYRSILNSSVDQKMYFGLGNAFITWEAVAREILKITRSKSNIVTTDLGWPDKPALFDVGAIKRDLLLSFNSWEKIQNHLKYLISIYE